MTGTTASKSVEGRTRAGKRFRSRSAPLHHLEANLEAYCLERRLCRKDGVRVAIVPAISVIRQMVPHERETAAAVV